MEHNNNINDFCGEISEILPHTPSKVDHFCKENGEISPIYDILLVKYIDLITLGGGIVGKQACSL